MCDAIVRVLLLKLMLITSIDANQQQPNIVVIIADDLVSTQK